VGGWKKGSVRLWLCIEDEDDEYDIRDRDPDWLKDIETAAALAELHDAVQTSTFNDDAGTIERLIRTAFRIDDITIGQFLSISVSIDVFYETISNSVLHSV